MRNTMKITTSSLIVLSLVMAGCSKSDDDKKAPTTTTTEVSQSPAEQGVATIEVTDAWCRTSAAMADAGACYMTISNGGPADDTLLSVSVDTSVAASAELHETVSADAADNGSSMSTDMPMDDTSHDADHATETTMHGSGAMTMREVTMIEIEADQTVKLEPGGYHIMLMGLAKPLEEGEKVALTLNFDMSGEMTIDAEVRSS